MDGTFMSAILPGANLSFNEVTTFTSPEYLVKDKSELWLGTSGGMVYVEIKGGDDTWRTYPELTFKEATAQLVTVRKGYIRFRVESAAPITLEVSL